MNISFFSKLCLRVPARALDFGVTDEEELYNLLNDQSFLNAVYLASPDVFELCQKIKQNGLNPGESKKLNYTIFKYYTRMSSRPTPFGLFSGFTSVEWGGITDIKLDSEMHIANIRLDMGVMAEITAFFEQQPSVRSLLSYQINTSAYVVGNEYRYNEFTIQDEKKVYNLTALQITPELKLLFKLCSVRPVKFKELSSLLRKRTNGSKQDVEDYLNNLIDCQFLISILQPGLAEKNHLRKLIGGLKNARKTNSVNLEILIKTAKLLSKKNFDAGTPDLIPKLEAIKQTLSKIIKDAPVNRNCMFQIDAGSASKKPILDSRLHEPLRDSIEALYYLSTAENESDWLKMVKMRIRSRFDSRKVSLAQIVDPETGVLSDSQNYFINYGSDLLNKLNNLIEQNSRSLPSYDDSFLRKFLKLKLQKAKESEPLIIEITKEDLVELKKRAKTKPLPTTFPVIFQLINDRQASILLETAGGASGSTLIGRFGYDAKLNSLLREIYDFDKQEHKNSIICRVTHLPDNRIGNVLQNPSLRDYEIPYLSKPAPGSKNIYINDLYVYLDGSTLRLYSKSLKKNVTPRIDNAHNYSAGTLPLYRLLGEMQNEDITPFLGLHLSKTFPEENFYPRFIYKGVILSRATWILRLDDLRQLISPEVGSLENLRHLCEIKAIPRFFYMVEGDQELLVDRENHLSAEVFINAVKKLNSVELKEFILPANAVGIKGECDRVYSHQFIAIAKVHAEALGSRKNAVMGMGIKRTFPPGSEWLYYKIYCSVVFCDRLLLEILGPMVKEWEVKGLIDLWFYVRYSDPEPHIRLRVKLTKPDALNFLITNIKNRLSHLLKINLIFKVEIDTYEREIERYGYKAIKIIERIFFIDSDYCLNLIRRSERIEQSGLSLLLLAVKKTDDIFNAFKFSIYQKQEIADGVYHSFSEELSHNPVETDILHRFYHSNINKIRTLFSSYRLTISDEDILKQIETCRTLEDQLLALMLVSFPEQAKSKEIACSLIHMHYNRLFHNNQRRFEMIGSMVLSKFYKSIKPQKKTSVVLSAIT